MSNGALVMMISAPCVIKSQKQFSIDFEIMGPRNRFGKGWELGRIATSMRETWVNGWNTTARTILIG